MSPIGASFAFGAPPSTAPGVFAEIGKCRRGTVDDRLADDVGRGERSVALDARVVVACPHQHRAGAEREGAGELRSAVIEGVDAAGQQGAAVRDEREQAAGNVGVSVAVHVPVRRGRRLRDGLLVEKS